MLSHTVVMYLSPQNTVVVFGKAYYILLVYCLGPIGVSCMQYMTNMNFSSAAKIGVTRTAPAKHSSRAIFMINRVRECIAIQRSFQKDITADIAPGVL